MSTDIHTLPMNPPAKPFDYEGTTVDVDHVRDIVNRRAARAVKVILDLKDRLDLPAALDDELRRVVRREIHDIADLANQFVESLAVRCQTQAGEQAVLNELYLRKLDEIHESIVIGNSDEA